ncbi:MAG: hypothetical protein JOY78_18165 [Pseudonocardia sp.]|nr:hypothetical protein [Pseudonocardia sp.]
MCYDRHHRLCVLSSPGDNDHRTIVVKVKDHDSKNKKSDSDSLDKDDDSSSTVANVPNPVFTQWPSVPAGSIDTGSTVFAEPASAA